VSGLFQIKICGVTNPRDAVVAAKAGADAIGLNFYGPSPRCVTESAARRIIAELPAEVARVGVFVNHPIAEILRLAETLPLDFIQLHGDEGPLAIHQLGRERVIRAFRLSDHRLPDPREVEHRPPGAIGPNPLTAQAPADADRDEPETDRPDPLAAVDDYLASCATICTRCLESHASDSGSSGDSGSSSDSDAAHSPSVMRQLTREDFLRGAPTDPEAASADWPRLVLLDAYDKHQYGGTGRTIDWETAARFAQRPAGPPLILAGGLTAENVAAAIEAVAPQAVDTASGVERAPGEKDHDLLRRFIATAREAFARIQ
jgi:phosphoribosylanthranilate isomerase